jgi:hypothetical protein
MKYKYHQAYANIIATRIAAYDDERKVGWTIIDDECRQGLKCIAHAHVLVDAGHDRLTAVSTADDDTGACIMRISDPCLVKRLYSLFASADQSSPR